jgi:CRP/FNR family transcriptional regulator
MNLEKFYSLLSDNAKELVQKNLKPFKSKRGDILYYAGDICKDLLFIDKGTIRVYVQGETGETFTLYSVNHSQPCIVNIFSTIFSSVTIANAEVNEDIQGWMLDRTILLQLLDSEPKYSFFLFSTVSKDIASLIDTIKDVKFSSISQQLEDWIFSHNISLIKTTHEQIATHLGTSRPVISTLLKDLENEKKIELRRGVIQIL